MLLGTWTPRLDDKGRIALPARWRDRLEDGVVLTKGQERCVYVFSAAEFARRVQALQAAPLSQRSVRTFGRVLFASASDEVPDKQGRVLVPAALRDWAGLQRECVAVGAGTRAELWAPRAWEEFLAQGEGEFAALGEELADVF